MDGCHSPLYTIKAVLNKETLIMKSQIVTTREELKSARKAKIEEIVVEGDLANQLKKVKKITKLGAWGLASLAAVGLGVGMAPITGGISVVAAAPAAALAGLEIAAIVAAASLGVALILAIFKDYEEIEFSDGRLILRKKSAT